MEWLLIAGRLDGRLSRIVEKRDQRNFEREEKKRLYIFRIEKIDVKYNSQFQIKCIIKQ